MTNNIININEQITTHYIRKGKVMTIWAYAVCTYLMRGLGYYKKDEFINRFSEFTGRSIKSIYRYMANLKEENLITEKKGVYYIVGKKALRSRLGISSKLCIKYSGEILKYWRAFKAQAIQQTGLVLQNRFRYSHDEMRKRSDSLFKMGRIESTYSIASTKDRVGVSQSKIAEYLNLSKSDVRTYINQISKRQYQKVGILTLAERDALLNQGFFKVNPMYTWKWIDKKPTLVHKLPSTLHCNYYVIKRNR